MNNILNCCRYKEILLRKTQALSFGMIVLRVKHSCKTFCNRFLFNGTDKFTLTKCFHVEYIGSSSPKTKSADTLTTVAGYEHIIRSCNHLCSTFKLYTMVIAVPCFNGFSVKIYGNRFFSVGLKPYRTARKPEIRQFSLPAVNEFLFENAIFITQGITHSRVILSCKTVKEASSKSAKTAVSKTCIRLLFI